LEQDQIEILVEVQYFESLQALSALGFG
jgi:hypothetical protein